MSRQYIVNFYTDKGVCYFSKEAKHVDITTYQTIIDFSADVQSERNTFRSYDEMQIIQVLGNMIKITFISGQSLVIFVLC